MLMVVNGVISRYQYKAYFTYNYIKNKIYFTIIKSIYILIAFHYLFLIFRPHMFKIEFGIIKLALDYYIELA